jgi:hypothetical protein
MEARVAIWIVSDPRPEHVRAISWLNEAAPADFYLLKIEGIRISGSLPAPLLTLIVGPSQESREVGEAKKERAERYHIRRRFFAGLLDRAKERTRLHAAISPSEHSWVGTGAGKSGLSFNYTITQHGATAELYIDWGSGEENQAIFDLLREQGKEIEAARSAVALSRTRVLPPSLSTASDLNRDRSSPEVEGFQVGRSRP